MCKPHGTTVANPECPSPHRMQPTRYSKPLHAPTLYLDTYVWTIARMQHTWLHLGTAAPCTQHYVAENHNQKGQD
jgi:hypothetical protein